MTPELIAAVKERLDFAYSEDAIRDELRSAGYDEESITAALAKARAERGEGESAATPSVLPEAGGAAGAGTVTLATPSVLIKNAFTYLKARPDAWAVLAAALAALTFLGWLIDTSDQLALMAGATALLVVTFVLYLTALVAVLHVTMESPERRVPLSEAFRWAWPRLGSFIWIYLLTALVVWGGFALLIIPGIIVSVYVYLAQYVRVKEGLRGLDALMRSRELVRGHWWHLVGRLLLVALIFILLFLAVFALIAGIAAVAGVNPEQSLLAEIFGQLVSAAFTLLGMHIGMQLYRQFAALRPTATESGLADGRTKYRGLGWLGLAVPIVGIIASIALASLYEAKSQASGAVELQLEEAKERAAELREREETPRQ